MKVKIKHVDGITDVIGKVYFSENGINVEYKKEGITWGRTMSIREAVDLKIINCPHTNIYPIIGFENSIIGERCNICGKEFL